MKRILNRNTRKLVTAIVVLIAAAVYRTGVHNASIPDKNTYYVKRVVDGDTIVLDNNERVRYIGINTPELHHPRKPVEYFGREALEFNKKLVEHKNVKLEYDVDIRDKYNRLLAYVHCDGVFVNAELVKEGYAQVYTFPPNVKYTDLFLKLEREARAAKRGLWLEPSRK